MKKGFSKKAHTFNEDNYISLKKLVDADLGLSVRQIAELTGWSNSTVYTVKNTNNYEEYRLKTSARLNKAKKQPIEQPKQIEVVKVDDNDTVKMVSNLIDILTRFEDKLDAVIAYVDEQEKKQENVKMNRIFGRI